MPPPPIKRILLAFRWYMPALHEGALKYCAEKGWQTSILSAENAEILAGEHYDGILSTLLEGVHPMYEFVAKAKVPVVELSESYPNHPEWGFYTSDRVATGRMAAEYLRRQPVASFAFIVPNDDPAHKARGDGFFSTLTEAGDARPVARFNTWKKGLIDYDNTTGAVIMNAEARREISTFLHSLPKPAAVFASTDQTAFQVAVAATEAGLKVPGDINLLGFGNRELLNRLSPVPISSISLDYIGWA